MFRRMSPEMYSTVQSFYDVRYSISYVSQDESGYVPDGDAAAEELHFGH